MQLEVVELFAGVGGFRLGLDERAGGYQTVWFNQWEPSVKTQRAYDCYVKNLEPDSLLPPESNMDIHEVPSQAIPDHDLLVGGFPCQDYSVASTLDKSHGLQGKKGVLWWQIERILTDKRPPYVLLENVDRLLRSPANQRGRDFGVLLVCMRDLGYMVEWRVLNAADYGQPQKRRRVFIFAAHETTDLGKRFKETAGRPDHLSKHGFFGPEFPVQDDQVVPDEPIDPDITLPKNLKTVSDDFEFFFLTAGVMHDGKVWTRKVTPKPEPIATLASVLKPCDDERYFVDEARIYGKKKGSWEYMKGSKDEERTAKNGHRYRYKEGPVPFPDRIDQPSRTILTGEGGKAPSRSNHIVEDPGNGRLRILTPEECEALNGFPRGWTEGIPERWRYFTMGNALVVGLVERMGTRLHAVLKETEKSAPKVEATA